MDRDIERIERLEKDFRVTQDSVLLIHRDLEQMSKSMAKLAESVSILASLQTDQKIMEERCETRHNFIKGELKSIASRVEKCEGDIDEINVGIFKACDTKSAEIDQKIASVKNTWFKVVVAVAGLGLSAVIYFANEGLATRAELAKINTKIDMLVQSK